MKKDGILLPISYWDFKLKFLMKNNGYTLWMGFEEFFIYMITIEFVNKKINFNLIFY